MLIPFDSMETKVIPHMRGGEKEVSVRMFADEQGKIMRGRLIPGATLGLHTHESSYEVIYILSGTATMLYEGEVETLPAGSCHYCPKGKSHSLRNESDAAVGFFAVVPELK